MDAYQSVDSLGHPADRSQDLNGFFGLVLLVQVLGIGAVVLVIVWLGQLYDGFSWADENKVFNYHPLFMILGLVFLYADAILVYRVFRHNRKLSIKILHAVMHILALVFAIVGLRAVFDSHNRKNKPNMYSLHSWIGLSVVIGFAVQWLIGFLTFLFPKFREENRVRVLKVHTVLGSLMFALVIAAALIGITEMNVGSKVYEKFHGREMIGNLLGVVLICFGALVLYLVNKSEYRRIEPLEDERILLKD